MLRIPADVYRAQTPYALAAFSLSEEATKDVAALERMLGRPLGEIRFDAIDLKQAQELGAARGEGWQAIIVGDDVAAHLAADQLARAVNTQRQRARTKRQVAPTADSDGRQPTARKPDGDAVDAEQQVEEARWIEREAERHAGSRQPP